MVNPKEKGEMMTFLLTKMLAEQFILVHLQALCTLFHLALWIGMEMTALVMLCGGVVFDDITMLTIAVKKADL